MDWALDKFKEDIQLVPLFPGESPECFKRFGSPSSSQESHDQDTIGFFVAKFLKR